jgi:type II secretory pathway pseudopilin PulG
MRKTASQGFSLIEVLVFIAILSMFFFSAITVSVYTMKNLRVSEERIIATQYAQELGEFFLSEKDTDWTTFHATADDILKNNQGCQVFDYFDIQWDTALDCSSNFGTGSDLTPFVRRAVFDVSASQVTVSIKVTWPDGKGGQYTVPLTTVYTQ